MTRPRAGQADSKLDALYKRPGFLIRRANQIAVWLFLDEAAPRPITSTQYGALVILRERHDLDQIGLAKLLRIDKSTTALVIGKLESAGHMRREVDPRDKRRNVLGITEAGRLALRDMGQPARRARDRLLAAFTPNEAHDFLVLLERYVALHGGDAPRQAETDLPCSSDARAHVRRREIRP